MGTDTTTDASKLLDEGNPIWTEVSAHPGELLAPLEAMREKLTADLAAAPGTAVQALAQYRQDAAEAKFDYIEPPREVVAFVFQDALERICAFCRSKA